MTPQTGQSASVNALLRAGAERARAELGKSPESEIQEDEKPVALKYALVAALSELEGGMEAIRAWARINSGAWERLTQAGAILAPKLAATLDLSGAQMHRATELAADTLLSERLCPEIVLPATPQAPPDAPVHLIVFTALPYIANEVYPLLVDALVAGTGSTVPVPVIAAHASWLEAGKARRAFWLDEARHVLVEAELMHPMTPVSAHILALDLRKEAQQHGQVVAMLGLIPLVNPPVGAEALDDKMWTGQVWAAAGLSTPRQWMVEAEAAGGCDGTGNNACPTDVEDVVGAINDAQCTGLVIKLRRGTEGRGVRFLASEDLKTAQAIQEALAAGEIVSEERGTLRFATAQGAIRFALRLNVCWDGMRAWAESGYAQVAGSPEGVASAGRGGNIVSLSELWPHLCDRAGVPVSAGREEWHAVTALAEAGVTALAAVVGSEMPLLVGVDVLLDGGNGQAILPLLLEANPRPAGSGHSRFFTPDGPGTSPGVSEHLWEAIARRRQGRA